MIPVSEHPPVPGYELLELRARNGHLIYRARQFSSGLLVDLHVVNSSGDFGEMVASTLRQQAAVLATLDHPNILRVVEIGDAPANGFFSALEHADGGHLVDRIRDRPLVWSEAAAVARAIASALQYARARDVHQVNLHPGAVLLIADHTPKLADFRRTDAGQANALHGKALTLSYAAPEEISDFERFESAPATDVYRVGGVLYALLTGQPAFSGGDTTATIQQVLKHSPTPVRHRNPTVPSDLEAICLRCLEKQQAHRFSEPGDLVDVISKFLEGTQPTA